MWWGGLNRSFNSVREVSQYILSTSLAHVKKCIEPWSIVSERHHVVYCWNHLGTGMETRLTNLWFREDRAQIMRRIRICHQPEERDWKFNFFKWSSNPQAAQQHTEECDIVCDESRASRCDAMRAGHAFLNARESVSRRRPWIRLYVCQELSVSDPPTGQTLHIPVFVGANIF
jgi:hypothetical protein